MKQIKVLFITHVLGMAGANRSMYQLILEQVKCLIKVI